MSREKAFDMIFDYSQHWGCMFKRSLGIDSTSIRCVGGKNCPQILELNDGNFAIVGTDITRTAKPSLPADAGCGPTERVVQIPRALLIRARKDIPSLL